MATAELGITWSKRLLAAWRAAPKSVFWRGYWETPARWHKNWFTYFYFLPALPGSLALWLYPTAITPLPTLEQATISEGTATISKHPSKGSSSIRLTHPTGERFTLSCRYGASIDPHCLGSYDIGGLKRFQGKPARVWWVPVPKGYISSGYLAVQIELDGEMVVPYDRSVERFNSGGLYSNEIIRSIAGTLFVYCLVVLFGFPCINYRHWLSSRKAGEASRSG